MLQLDNKTSTGLKGTRPFLAFESGFRKAQDKGQFIEVEDMTREMGGEEILFSHVFLSFLPPSKNNYFWWQNK